MKRKCIAIMLALCAVVTTACGGNSASNLEEKSVVSTETEQLSETSEIAETEILKESFIEQEQTTEEEFDVSMPEEFTDYRKFIGKDISFLGIELDENENSGFVYDVLESQFLGHKGTISVQYDVQDGIIWSINLNIEDSPLTVEEYDDVCSKVSKIFGTEKKENTISYDFTGLTDFYFRLPKVDKLQMCAIGWNADKCSEFFDNRHKNDNDDTTSESVDNSSKNLCTNGSEHSWKGNMTTGAITCTVCSEVLTTESIKEKHGENLTSAEKAKIYHVLDSYLTAMDSKGKYLYSVDEAYSKTESEFGVTKTYLDNNIWNGHAYDDHVKYYVNKTGTGSGSSTGTSVSWKEVTNSDDRNICWSLAEQAVKSKLKSPSSAKFPFSYSSNGVTIEYNGNSYRVKSYVDADNSFGANLRSNFTVYIEKSGSTFTVTSCTIEE